MCGNYINHDGIDTGYSKYFLAKKRITYTLYYIHDRIPYK